MICGLASFICPGLGQAIARKPVEGLCWFLGTVVGYLLLVIPGLIIHGFCVKNAIDCGEERERYIALVTAAEIERLKAEAKREKPPATEGFAGVNSRRAIDLWKQG